MPGAGRRRSPGPPRLASRSAWIRRSKAASPGLRYVLLHSFSHALMRRLALECGYSAASIQRAHLRPAARRERRPDGRLLIYTAAPDSEGTLGGLVSLGRPEVLGGM